MLHNGVKCFLQLSFDFIAPMGNNGVMTAKDARIAVRVDPELKARIAQIVERTGIDEATLVRNCIEALCAHVERAGQISFPLTVNTAPGPIPNSTRYPPPVARHTARLATLATGRSQN